MIESSRLEFKPFKETDFESVKEILGNPNVCKFLPGNNEKSDDELHKWHAFFVKSFNDDLGNKVFAISLKGTDEIIGYGGLGYVKEFDQIEIMYGFKQDVWGKGFGSETSLRMKEYAKELGLEFLIAIAHVENIGSQKVLLKTGFTEKDTLNIWGIDAYYYEMSL